MMTALESGAWLFVSLTAAFVIAMLAWAAGPYVRAITTASLLMAKAAFLLVGRLISVALLKLAWIVLSRIKASAITENDALMDPVDECNTRREEKNIGDRH